jgi:hypothetical protein
MRGQLGGPSGCLAPGRGTPGRWASGDRRGWCRSGRFHPRRSRWWREWLCDVAQAGGHSTRRPHENPRRRWERQQRRGRWLDRSGYNRRGGDDRLWRRRIGRRGVAYRWRRLGRGRHGGRLRCRLGARGHRRHRRQIEQDGILRRHRVMWRVDFAYQQQTGAMQRQDDRQAQRPTPGRRGPRCGGDHGEPCPASRPTSASFT